MPLSPPPALEFAEDFIQAIDASQATKRTYRAALQRLARFLVGDQSMKQVPLSKLKRTSLVEFRRWLAEMAEHHGQGRLRPQDPEANKKRRSKHGYDIRTVRNSLVAAYRFLEWLDVNGKLPVGLSAADMQAVLKNSKGRRRMSYRPKPIREAVPLIVNYYAQLPTPPPDNDRLKRHALTLRRNQAMTRTLFCAGLRAQELVNLTRGDWDTDRNILSIMGKGEKPRRVGLDEDTQTVLLSYLKDREAYYGESNYPAKEPLFARHDPMAQPNAPLMRITTKTVWEVVAQAVEGLKAQGYQIMDSISPHDVRRFVASAMLSEGMRLESVQSFLGHASPETTRIVYAHTWDEVLADEVATYRPTLSTARARAEAKVPKNKS